MQPLNIPGESFEAFVARISSGCMVAKEVDRPEVPKPRRPKKLKAKQRRMLEAAAGMPPSKIRLLLDLLAGRRFLLGGYAVAKTAQGFSLEGIAAASEREHFVNVELTLCSCEDCRFRNRECKHILLLKEAKL